MKAEWKIRRLEPGDWEERRRMRLALWPDQEAAEPRPEMEEIQADPSQPVFVLERSGRRLGGFLEAALRKDASGCRTQPGGYLEGWYTGPDLRRQKRGRGWPAAARWPRTASFGKKSTCAPTWHWDTRKRRGSPSSARAWNSH